MTAHSEARWGRGRLARITGGSEVSAGLRLCCPCWIVAADESTRHAITKFAQFHFPSTRRSAEYLVRMGERPDTVLGVGCPGSDIARAMDRALNPAVINRRGSGAEIDVSKPFLLVLFHPTTTEFGGERKQMEELVAALDTAQQQTVLLWPNIDAGSDHVSKVVRQFRDLHRPAWLRTLINLPPEEYSRVLANTACAVGNSSSFVRDAGYYGTPVVLVGNRQDGRETDDHVLRARPIHAEVLGAIRQQLSHGRYAPSTLYGDGQVAQRIAEGLATLSPYVQKRLHFIHDVAGQPEVRSQ